MIAEFLQETIRLLQQLDQAAIARARDILLDCYRRRGRVFTAGNGGSASTAQHFACDLAKFVIPDGGRPFDVRCLTDNISLYTAWANDAAREDVFVNQMRELVQPGDVLILTSVHGGILHQESTCSILVPVESTPQTEAIHLVIEHLLMDLLKRELAKGVKA